MAGGGGLKGDKKLHPSFNADKDTGINIYSVLFDFVQMINYTCHLGKVSRYAWVFGVPRYREGRREFQVVHGTGYTEKYHPDSCKTLEMWGH